MAVCGIFFAALSCATGANPDPANSMPARKVVLKTAPSDGRLFRIPPPVRYRAGAPKSASFTIKYLAAGETNIFGDTCIGWPENAKAAFSYAANIWGSLLNSPVPISINACWANMTPANVLGHGGASKLIRDFAGAPSAGTFYPVSIANACATTDLLPGNEKIVIAYNAQQPWYLGTDGNCPQGQYDFATVIMHEICHGLGFLGTWDYDDETNQGAWGEAGVPLAFDRFIINGSSQYLLDTALFANPSVALGAQLTGDNLFFAGICSAFANGGIPPSIYAPSEWSDGSSACHLGEIFRGTPNAMMVYSFPDGYSIHNPGAITMGLLTDIGWTVGAAPRAYIGINGSLDNLTLSTADPLLVQIALMPGDNAPAVKDWWLAADTSIGAYQYTVASGWQSIPNLAAVQPAYQGSLFELPATSVLSMPSLPPGTYTFYFGVDAMNGKVDPHVIFGSITATVQ